MNEREFIAKMAEILEEEESAVKFDSTLDSFDAWDSLARITFLVFASEEFKKRIDGSAVKDAANISDLYQLVIE